MSFQMSLWRVAGNKLEQISSSRLDQEQRLEDWICADPSILGMDIAVIGRQVHTEFGGKIDLLAIDHQANCVLLELKRGRTPRDVVAQLLDYASWVKDLGYDDMDQIARKHHQRSLAEVYQEAFGSTIPDTVNVAHSMIVVASHLDGSSERIINYLSDDRGVSINAVFFCCFSEGGAELLGRAWLKDPSETIEGPVPSKRSPWTGYWYVNVGEGSHRNWDDNREYGYIGAGQDEKYSRPLRHLAVGDKIFAYMKGRGYTGYGEVTQEAVRITEFVVGKDARTLLDLPLKAPHADENKESPELSEWAVGISWLRVYTRDEAKTFKGVFANQNVVCKLRDPKTIEFLETEFGAK